MDALVEFTEVRPLTPDPQLLRGFSLDAPRIADGWRAPASYSNTYGFDVRGWAVGAGSAVEAVELLHHGGVLTSSTPDVPRPDIGESLADVPAEQQVGFFLSINALALELDFELQLRALLRNGEVVELATMSGRRSPLDSGHRTRLQPLMVTTIGRTGSSMLVHLLGAHPSVVAYRPFRVEPRVASYWIGVLRSLSEPASYRRQMQGRNLQDPTWWLGTEGRVARRTQDAEFQDWLGSEAVRTLAGFAQSRIDEVYARIAGLQQRPDAAYFAEKYQPDAVPPLMWELYPDAREIVLVRDFRDMLCSILAFNSKRGVQGFGRDRAATDAEFVDEMGKPAAALARSWEQRASRAHLVRYEDLVSRPAETVEGLLDYVGIDGGEQVVRGMLSELDQAGDEAAKHRTTSAGTDESIGRWRAELGPELLARCEQAFGPALEAFGYPVAAHSE
jgi:sulfotransferase family protein